MWEQNTLCKCAVLTQVDQKDKKAVSKFFTHKKRQQHPAAAWPVGKNRHKWNYSYALKEVEGNKRRYFLNEWKYFQLLTQF